MSPGDQGAAGREQGRGRRGVPVRVHRLQPSEVQGVGGGKVDDGEPDSDSAERLGRRGQLPAREGEAGRPGPDGQQPHHAHLAGHAERRPGDREEHHGGGHHQQGTGGEQQLLPGPGPPLTGR
ncbi:hypothetical protein [uncultured Friedmanniella sp.]|uniref:hypothetical protein n=1 Tax=uncultured Friedmanniella sp. TaxID=335381 RepID=UPI0035CA28AB